MSGHRYPPEVKVRAFALIREGKPQNEVARLTGIPKWTISDWLNTRPKPKISHSVGHRVAGQQRNMTPLRVEEQALELMKLIPPDTRDLTGRLAGDPIRGRSALDKRMSQNV